RILQLSVRVVASAASALPSFFFFYCSGDHRALHSFPTRRSSDLLRHRLAQLARARHQHALDVVAGRPHPLQVPAQGPAGGDNVKDRKSTRLNSSHDQISYAVFCLKKKKNQKSLTLQRTSSQIPPP